MEKMSKKEFMSLHDNNQISLVVSAFKTDKESLNDKIEKFVSEGNKLPAIKLSRCDIGNQGEYCITSVYKHNNLYYVESVIDNSKCDTCSWNYTEVNTVAYSVNNTI